MKLKLWTEGGDGFVTREVPDQQPAPLVVCWGGRCFVLTARLPDQYGSEVIYHERAQEASMMVITEDFPLDLETGAA